jgi:putative transposase
MARLRRQQYKVDRKRVCRLIQQLGLEAIQRKPNLSRKHPANPIYRYPLHRQVIDRPKQVWAMYLTYLPIRRGFIYQCAVIDRYSRAVLSWELSNTLDASWCVQAVARAMQEHGCRRSSILIRAVSLPPPSLPGRSWPQGSDLDGW